MTTTLTRRNRDPLTFDAAKDALRHFGYVIDDNFPAAPGATIARLNLAGFQATFLIGDPDTPWCVLLSRVDQLLRAKFDQLVNHAWVPLDVRAVVATGRKLARDIAHAALADTVTVRVRDRASEGPWGSGFTNPCVRDVVISRACRVCGERRGEPRNSNECDDGAFYSVDVWTNPCGHSDYYTYVLAEARALELAAKAVTR